MATAAPEAEAAPAGGGGKKKLIMIIVIALVVVLVGVGAAVMLLKKKPPADEDPFTVNLADKDVDRYAQVSVTLEVVDQKTSDMIKSYMPAIRSGILLVLSHKTAAEMLSKEGKALLQKEIQAEAVRPLGFEVTVDEEEAEEEEPPKKKKKKKKRAPMALPVTQVLFAQLIVQ
jgi:flagellar protein FliL